MFERLSAIFLLITALACAALPAPAAERPPGLLPGYLTGLSCQLAGRTHGQNVRIVTLAEAFVNTLSEIEGERTFSALLPNKQVLSADIRHVHVRMPRDRFNVTLLLDDRPHLRINHLDLDIYVETTIEGKTYLLHCAPIEEPVPVNGGGRSGERGGGVVP